MAGASGCERVRAAESQERRVLRGDGRGEREGESWIAELEELRGAILERIPGQLQMQENTGKRRTMRLERRTKALDQNVEAEMGQAEGEQRSGLERQRLVEMLACQTLRWAESWRQGESEARSYLEKGNQAEGKGRQTQRQTEKYMEPGKERRPGAKEAGSASLSPHLSQETLALQDSQQNEELLWKAAERGWRAGLDVRARGMEGPRKGRGGQTRSERGQSPGTKLALSLLLFP